MRTSHVFILSKLLSAELYQLHGLRNVSPVDIISACSWQVTTKNLFTAFYLRDLVDAEGQLLVFKHVPSVGHQ